MSMPSSAKTGLSVKIVRQKMTIKRSFIWKNLGYEDRELLSDT
jgi:hypothetical protein